MDENVMDLELREILYQIDMYLSTGDVSKSAALWAVLSALRGPDDEAELTKLATTAVIRAKAFPLTAKLSHATGGRVRASMIPDRDTSVFMRQHMKFSHFVGHARDAFRALGLSWRSLNE